MLRSSVEADQPPRPPIVPNRSGAAYRVAALLPAFDTEWLNQSGSVRPIALLLGLAALAIIALLIASAAHRRDQHARSREADDQLYTATPLPMPKEQLAQLRRESTDAQAAYSGVRLPRWLQIGSLAIALGFTWLVAQRIRPENEAARQDGVRIGGIKIGGSHRAQENDSPEDLDLSPDSAPVFAFRARDWVASDGGCAGRLEVTKGAAQPFSLTARVHDDQGQLLDSARTRVTALREGDVVEFKFARAACDRIGAWDVRGAHRD